MSDIENTNENIIKKNNKNELTEEEKKEYLKNSILIPKEQWLTLPVNSFISYIKNDGKFIKGGFIKLIFKKKEKDYLIYSSKLDKYNNDKYYKEFTINLENIKEIYKKIDSSAIIEYQIIKTNINNFLDKFKTDIHNIYNKIEDLNIKINKIEDNNKKTIKLIKNLHGIKSLDDIKK
jgi:hypothetical protein